MYNRHTVIRSMHDVGLAAWFGGSLMGAVGLNGATGQAKDPTERLRLSSKGWGRWTPWQLAAVAVHGIGAVGLVVTNRDRIKHQRGAQTNSLAKTVLTVLAALATAYSAYLGTVTSKRAGEGAVGATEPAEGQVSPELESAQKQLKVLQWAIPALTGPLLVLGAQQGEQQREAPGLLDKLRRH